MKRSWTISGWLAVIFVGAVVCSGLAVSALLHEREEASVRAIAESRAESAARYVFEHVYSAMQQGTEHEEIAGIITRLNRSTDASRIDLIQGEAVARQYGAAPEAQTLRDSDPLVARAFAEKMPLSDTPEPGTLRFLYPLLLASECQACHQGTPNETVNGVIDLRFPLEPLRAPLAFISDAAFWAFLAALGLIFLALFLMVRLVVVRPIHALADAMARLTQAEAPHERVAPPHPSAREVHTLAGAFNTLMDHVERQRAALQDHARDLATAKDSADAARLQADDANRAKSEFLASMSHELRTPLNAILGFSELMRDETFGPLGQPVYQGYVRDIHQSGAHLRDLINDLLDLARIEAGRLDPSPEPLDVAAETRGCVDLFRTRADQARLTLSSEVPETLPPLVADRRALRQMLYNLVSNAIKYSRPEGQVRVTAHQGQDGIEIAVTDTGPGIDKAFHELVFSAYGRIVNLETRNIEGTGLGLALVKAMMEAHGGTVDLNSVPGQGSTFTLRFPRVPVEPAPPVRTAQVH
jgi:signal transduction histidine kinase